jgi:hypothetical protein
MFVQDPENDLVPGSREYALAIFSHARLQSAVALVRDPDYISVSGSVGFWSGSVKYLPASGHWYVTPIGGGLGTPGISVTGGYLNRAGVDPNNFVSAWGISGCAFAGLGGCTTYSPGSGWAKEVGFGTPSFGVSGGYTLRVNPHGNPYLF